MSDDLWIVVPNWDKFQHYGNRRDTPWIKVYCELNSRDEWRQLPFSERGLLVTIWLEYQRSGGQLRASDIGLRGGQRARSRSIEALNHAGFIQLVASKPLALRALAREEVEEEKKEPVAHAPKPNTTRLPFSAPAEATPASTNRVNAGAYKRFVDESDQPFDEEAAIAEITARAEAKGWRAPR